MAGIGFRLQSLFERETFTAEAAGHVGAAAIFTGPWVFGTISILSIYVQARMTLSGRHEALLFAMITYAAAGAMLLTAPLTFAISRYMADFVYSGDFSRIGPICAAAWVLHLVVAMAAGAGFYLTDDLTGVQALLATGLLVAFVQLWLAGAFVAMHRAHISVLATFSAGYAIGTLASLALGYWYGLEGYLLGYWIGAAGIALRLTATLVGSWRFERASDMGFVGYVRRRPAFLAAGLGLAAGAWIDKIVMWGARGVHVSKHLVHFPTYDVVCAMGALTALPGLAWLLLSVETSFATDARGVYNALAGRAPLKEIGMAKLRLTRGMTRALWGLMRVQLPVTVLVVVYARDLLEWIGVPSTGSHILRFAALGSVGLVLLQAQVLYFLYFDLPGRAAVATTTYFTLNLLLSWGAVRAGPAYYGLAPAVAAWAAALVAGLTLNREVRVLERSALRHYALLSFRASRKH